MTYYRPRASILCVLPIHVVIGVFVKYDAISESMRAVRIRSEGTSAHIDPHEYVHSPDLPIAATMSRVASS